MSCFVVIPTYNERENIVELCQEIRSLGGDWHIVVVDDNSPDGTAELVEQLRARDRRVHLLRRPGKLGYASAAVAGFRYSLAQGADYIGSMDADFSHHPRYLPELLAQAEKADVVIGSRYVKGGGTLNWGWLRRFLSRGANEVAVRLLSLPVKDCTAGFRCYRRAVLENFDFEGITVEGYSFLIEMTFLCHRRGYLFAQVPIIFADRERGRSKISKRIILEAVGLVLRLFFQGGGRGRGGASCG